MYKEIKNKIIEQKTRLKSSKIIDNLNYMILENEKIIYQKFVKKG